VEGGIERGAEGVEEICDEGGDEEDREGSWNMSLQEVEEGGCYFQSNGSLDGG
jgi:hypothetical protein